MSFQPSERISAKLFCLLWEMEMSKVYIDPNVCVKVLFFKVVVYF